MTTNRIDERFGHVATNRRDFLRHLSSFIPKNSVCVEVGVENGLFSELILDEIDPSQLFLIDPWETVKGGQQYTWSTGSAPTSSSGGCLEMVKEKFSSQIINNKVILKKGFSYDVVDEFPDDFFDFIYIDACHLYECVRDDLEMFLPKLKSGGLMCGHDYIDFKQCAESGWAWEIYVPEIGMLSSLDSDFLHDFGVIQAVDEFIVNNNFEWVAITEPNFIMKQVPDFALKRA